MDNNSDIEQTLITAYRKQSAPRHLHNRLVENFEEHSQNKHRARRHMAFAFIAVCVVTAIAQITYRPTTSKVFPARVSLHLSTASLQALPSLSSIRLSTNLSKTSLNNLKPDALAGKYRETMNLANDLL